MRARGKGERGRFICRTICPEFGCFSNGSGALSHLGLANKQEVSSLPDAHLTGSSPHSGAAPSWESQRVIII